MGWGGEFSMEIDWDAGLKVNSKTYLDCLSSDCMTD